MTYEIEVFECSLDPAALHPSQWVEKRKGPEMKHEVSYYVRVPQKN